MNHIWFYIKVIIFAFARKKGNRDFVVCRVACMEVDMVGIPLSDVFE